MTPQPPALAYTEAVISTAPFVVRRRVLFGDCDPGGVVYTPRFAEYVVWAAHHFLAHRLGGPAVRQLVALGILPPARALSLEFLRPLAWDDDVDLRVEVADLGHRAFTLAVTGTDATSATAFTARLTLVTVSPETRQAVELPSALRRALEADRVSPADPQGASPGAANHTPDHTPGPDIVEMSGPGDDI